MLCCTAEGTVFLRSALPCQQQAPQTSVGRCLLLQVHGAGLNRAPTGTQPPRLQPGGHPVQHLWLRHLLKLWNILSVTSQPI